MVQNKDGGGLQAKVKASVHTCFHFCDMCLCFTAYLFGGYLFSSVFQLVIKW